MSFLLEKIVPSGEKFSFLKRIVVNTYSEVHFVCQLMKSRKSNKKLRAGKGPSAS
jgi:hypothetical protein